MSAFVHSGKSILVTPSIISNSPIQFSEYDLRRNIVIPKNSKEFAEFLGMLAGDGHLLDTIKIHKIEIFLNLTEDVYYLDHVKKIIQNLFNLNPKIVERKDKGTFDIVLNSKAITNSVKKQGFPSGKKNGKLKIPDWILKNNSFLVSYLKGIFDTDGSLFFAKRGTYSKNSYPVIEIKIYDQDFIQQIHSSLLTLGFKCNLSKFKVQLNGKNNLEKWLTVIGISNYSILTRFILWKILTYCPTKTTLKERIELINARVPERFNLESG